MKTRHKIKAFGTAILLAFTCIIGSAESLSNFSGISITAEAEESEIIDISYKAGNVSGWIFANSTKLKISKKGVVSWDDNVEAAYYDLYLFYQGEEFQRSFSIEAYSNDGVDLSDLMSYEDALEGTYTCTLSSVDRNGIKLPIGEFSYQYTNPNKNADEKFLKSVINGKWILDQNATIGGGNTDYYGVAYLNISTKKDSFYASFLSEGHAYQYDPENSLVYVVSEQGAYGLFYNLENDHLYFIDANGSHRFARASDTDAVARIKGNYYRTDRVKELDLSGENLTDKDIKELAKFKNLRVLNLGSKNHGQYNTVNSITDVTPLSKLTKLEKLVLDNNQIQSISGLSKLKKLNVLDLSQNPIKDYSSLAKLTNLRILTIGSDSLNNLSTVSKLKKMKVLHIFNYSGMNTTFDFKNLTAMDRLSELSLSGVRAKNFTAISSLKSLRILDLYDNGIKDISPLKSLKNLTTVSIYENYISDLSPLSDHDKIKHLYISGGNLSDLSAISTLKKLQTLCLIDCGIKDISALSSLKYLSILYLMHNQISDITPLSKLTALSTLNLSDNQIKSVKALSGLKSLKSLVLSNNKITDVSLLKSLTLLDELWLDGNNITDTSVLNKLNIEYLVLNRDDIMP